jgi:lipopolysaccharide export system protein LptA
MRLSQKAPALTALAAVAALSLGGPALAQWSANPNAPVSVSAEEQGAFNTSTCVSNWRGNVEVTQDRIRLRARTLTTHHVKRGGSCGDISRMEAENDVYYVTPNEAVRADKAVYNLTADTVTFTGGVIVQRGQNVATSERLVINLRNNDAALSGRVRGVFYPSRSGQ